MLLEEAEDLDEARPIIRDEALLRVRANRHETIEDGPDRSAEFLVLDDGRVVLVRASPNGVSLFELRFGELGVDAPDRPEDLHRLSGEGLLAVEPVIDRLKADSDEGHELLGLQVVQQGGFPEQLDFVAHFLGLDVFHSCLQRDHPNMTTIRLSSPFERFF